MTDLGPWREEAACADDSIPADLFFPNVGAHNPEAFRICQGCPVRIDCGLDAVEDHCSDVGIRGGMTNRDRIDVRLGRLTLQQAMNNGDKTAATLTRKDRLARDEPWLLSVGAVPVAVRDYHRPKHVA